LLAAGSGQRFGSPKALLDTGSGAWVVNALQVLGGCDETVVVIGAAADQVTAVLPAGTRTVRNTLHTQGMGSSLAVGLRVLDAAVDAALVMLVDLPDVTRAVADRLTGYARQHPDGRGVLARAAYRGHPGHPVLIGRDHFEGVLAGAAGDAGARDYLQSHPPVLLECGDIGGGRDVDTPDQL
jgi:CTP:molybdopterin cytidylyltransferase MocA